MISHKHKCIFIHISKCAGSSIENSFGIDISDNSERNNKNLFGWSDKLKLYLQHATPQELLAHDLIRPEIWKNYYKFIIVRNPWDRALSDYMWISKEQKIKDTFSNFLLKKGAFQKSLWEYNPNQFRGDHLTPQKDYFFVNGRKIKYDRILRFENLENELIKLASDLNISSSFFKVRVNVSKKRFSHYSKFYNYKRKKIVLRKYQDDIKFLEYKFVDQRNMFDYINSLRSSVDLIE